MSDPSAVPPADLCGAENEAGVACILPDTHRSVLHAGKVDGLWMQWADPTMVREVRGNDPELLRADRDRLSSALRAMAARLTEQRREYRRQTSRTRLEELRAAGMLRELAYAAGLPLDADARQVEAEVSRLRSVLAAGGGDQAVLLTGDRPKRVGGDTRSLYCDECGELRCAHQAPVSPEPEVGCDHGELECECEPPLIWPAEPAPEVTPRSVNPPEPTAEEFRAAYERGEGVPVMDEAPPVVAAGPGREAEGLEPTAGLEPAASGSVPGALRSGSRTPGSDRPADGSSELRRPAQSTAPADPVEPPEPPPSWPPVVDEDALYVARQYFDRSGLVWNDDRARLYINAYLAAADAGDRARALVGQTTEEGHDE